MPRPRFRLRLRTLLIAVAVVAVALGIHAASPPARLGCGDAVVSLAFRVVDDRDGRPIEGATIEVFNDMGRPPMASTASGPDGVGRVSFKTGCTWYSRPFFRTTRALNLGELLRIEAPGYQGLEAIIRDLEFWRNFANHNLHDPPPVVIRLKGRFRPPRSPGVALQIGRSTP